MRWLSATTSRIAGCAVLPLGGEVNRLAHAVALLSGVVPRTAYADKWVSKCAYLNAHTTITFTPTVDENAVDYNGWQGEIANSSGKITYGCMKLLPTVKRSMSMAAPLCGTSGQTIPSGFTWLSN